MPVVLASYNPSYQEHVVLSDDFFEAVVVFDLGLDELKQLCKNSIVYSGLDESQKNKMLEDWQIAWDEFIKEVNK